MDSEAHPLPLVRSGPPADGGAPPFERIAVVGLGLIGGSIALASRAAWPSSLVIGVDEKPVLEQAVTLHAVDVAASDLTIISEADLVILAAPVLQNDALIERIPEYIEKPAVITDVGSTKRSISDAARSLPDRFAFVGGHPLAGAAKGGIAAARPDLFTGRPWFFTGGQGEELDRLFRFARALGANPHSIDAAAHDRLVAFISHLPQLTASALLSTVGESAGEEALSFSGRGLDDTTRLAASPADIWVDICKTNMDEIGAALDRLIAVLGMVRGNLDRPQTIERLFADANKWRSVLVASRDKNSM